MAGEDWEEGGLNGYIPGALTEASARRKGFPSVLARAAGWSATIDITQ